MKVLIIILMWSLHRGLLRLQSSQQNTETGGPGNWKCSKCWPRWFSRLSSSPLSPNSFPVVPKHLFPRWKPARSQWESQSWFLELFTLCGGCLMESLLMTPSLHLSPHSIVLIGPPYKIAFFLPMARFSPYHLLVVKHSSEECVSSGNKLLVFEVCPC